jgi:NAD(P)H dehydrogenase (quinone)
MKMNKILVTGATGPLGAAVTQTLLKSKHAGDIRILVRDAAKAAEFKAQGVDVVTGDYDDEQSLVDALTGIDQLFLVSGNDIEKRARQHGNVIGAAGKNKVKKIVYVSLQRKDDGLEGPVADKTAAHLDTERIIRESGMTYTILQVGLYSEMISIFAGQQLLDTKTIYLPAGDGKAAYALRAELGEAGAIIAMDETGQYDNKVLEITGPEALSWQDIAEILTEIRGEKFTYVSPPVEEFIETFKKAGAPEWLGPAMAGMQQAVAQDEYGRVSPLLENLLGRKPQTVDAYLRSVYSK